jgi:hypothetical protein
VTDNAREAFAQKLRTTWRTTGDAKDVIPREAFGKLVKDAFSKVSVAAPVTRARVIGELDVSAGEGTLMLQFHVSLSTLSFPIETTLAATAKAEGRAGEARLLKKGVADLATAARELMGMVDADTTLLVRQLDSSEPDVQMTALRLLAHRKPPGAAKALCHLLSDPREAVAEAAAETIIDLGDASVASDVIASIDPRSLRSEVRAIEILGHIGGSEARAYLEMTALGHEVSEVRILSKTLLHSMKKTPPR